MLTDKLRKTIAQNNLIEKGEHIVVGVSGGPDSVCLLSVLLELAEEWELTLHVVHVNHQLRGERQTRINAIRKNYVVSLGFLVMFFVTM